MLEKTYKVTKTPEIDGVHFVHHDACQVLPVLEMEELGTFETAEAAMEKARARFEPLNACALCCPESYVPTEKMPDT